MSFRMVTRSWTGIADRFCGAYQPTPDAATLRRARGWAVLRALSGILIGEAGVHGRAGGKATWGPPATAALRRLVATVRRPGEHGPAAYVTDARRPAHAAR